MPKVSVVIPTFNRAHLIKHSINSLLAQTFSDYEIIVIDDGSSDNTKEILEFYQDKIRYVYQKNRGISGARNCGIQEATGEYIAFTDDDVIVDSNWLTCIMQCFKEHECDVVGGRVLPIYPDSTPFWIRNKPTKISGGVIIYDYGEKTFPHPPSNYLFIGANFAFRKQIFKECGCFREDLKYNRIALGEDTELIDRIMKKNKILYYCGKAIVHHPVDMNRLTLRYAAHWNMTLGRFAARQETENKDKHFVYWFGIPRYLYKGIILDFLQLCKSIFNYPALYDACRSFFRKAGMIREYRQMIREKKAR